MKKKTSYFRSTFFAGIFAVLPLVITVYLLRLLYRLITSNLMPLLGSFFAANSIEMPEHLMGALTVILFVLIIFFVGVLIKFYLGRSVFRVIEHAMTSIPLVKTIYNTIRQMVESLKSTTNSFEKVVLVKFPSPEYYCLGYVIRGTQNLLQECANLAPSYNVFIPTAPNPTSGFIAIIPIADCIEVPVTVEEGVKFILSVGILNFQSEDDAMNKINKIKIATENTETVENGAEVDGAGK